MGDEKVVPLANRVIDYWNIMQRAQHLFLRAAKRSSAQPLGDNYSFTDPGSVLAAYVKVGMAMATRPGDLIEIQKSAFEKLANAWMSGWTDDSEDIKDRRFREGTWQRDPLARVCRDVHLAMEDVKLDIVNRFPKRSKDQLKVQFFTRQILSTLAPSNSLALNPQARERLLESSGQGLLDGFSNFLDDMERGDGVPEISTNDEKAFVVGQDLGATAGKVVYQNDLMQRIQYEPRTETRHKRPLLLVPAWINEFYIFDLREKNSFVRFALDQGHTVFVISWVNPGSEHADKAFDDYMTEGPLAALDAIEKATGEKKVNILGFCIGGIPVTATLAYLAAKGDKRIASATTLATMVDFTDVGEVGVFIDDERLASLGEHVEETGHLEAHQIRLMFSTIRENDLIWSFHVMNYLMGSKPPAFELLFWNSDSIRMPAKMLLWYLEKLYLQNALREPCQVVLDGTEIDIGKIDNPCFVLATRDDHIAPWRSVYPTVGLLGGEAKFVLGESGHIAGVVNPPSERQKYGYWTREDYLDDHEQWLEGSTHHKGSWWPLCCDWIESQDKSSRVPARVPGDGGLQTIEDAPGSYVLVH